MSQTSSDVQGWPEPYTYTVYLVISLPKIPYMHRICMVLANPSGVCCYRIHADTHRTNALVVCVCLCVCTCVCVCVCAFLSAGKSTLGQPWG